MDTFQHTISKICSDEGLDDQLVTQRLGTFGKEALGKARLLAASINSYYDGSAVLDKNGVNELHNAIISLRHIDWLFKRAESYWLKADDRRGPSFANAYGASFHALVAVAEREYKELLEVVKL
jgi:hypothetical protein